VAVYPPVGSVPGDPTEPDRPVYELTAGGSKDAAGMKTSQEDAAKTWALTEDAAKTMAPRASTRMTASVPTAVSVQTVDGTESGRRWSLAAARIVAVCLAGTQTEDDPLLTTRIRHPASSSKSDVS
jgi:hypothetical protein